MSQECNCCCKENQKLESLEDIKNKSISGEVGIVNRMNYIEKSINHIYDLVTALAKVMEDKSLLTRAILLEEKAKAESYRAAIEKLQKVQSLGGDLLKHQWSNNPDDTLDNDHKYRKYLEKDDVVIIRMTFDVDKEKPLANVLMVVGEEDKFSAFSNSLLGLKVGEKIQTKIPNDIRFGNYIGEFLQVEVEILEFWKTTKKKDQESSL